MYRIAKRIIVHLRHLLSLRRSQKFYSQFIKKGDLCFDVGANMGNQTKMFLKLGARVVCIEPQQNCLKKLRLKFGNNQDVIIVGKALGKKDGYANILISDKAPTISTMSNKWKKKGRFSDIYKQSRIEKVSVTTLDSLMAKYGLPKFCKIDVEGFEESVLIGLTKKIPFISFEFTKEFLNDAVRCANYLASIGKVKFNYSLEESMKLFLTEWVTPQELFKKLKEGSDSLLWGDIYARFI